VKFIHAADLHLDSPFLGLTSLPAALLTQVRQSTFTAATRIFDRAVAEDVDFVVLAGDLFDRAEQSVAAQAYLFTQFDRLRAAKIPVFISFGNHDYATDQHQAVAYPENVRVFGPDVSTQTLTLRSGETVAISGFSYPQRWVETDPVTDFPPHAATDWHIGLLHGAVATGGTGDHYAPFTVADLLAKRYDYSALGHIHHRQLLNQEPPVLYAGNPQGRSVAETGDKGAYLVTSQGQQLTPTFFATADVLWATDTLDFAGTTLPELESALTTWITAYPAKKVTLTALTVALHQPLTAEDQAAWRATDWLTLYQRTHRAALTTAQRYLTKLTVVPPKTGITAPQLDQQYWDRGAAQTFTPVELQTLFGKLAQEPALAEWFNTQATPEKLQVLATQNLRELLDREAHDVS